MWIYVMHMQCNKFANNLNRHQLKVLKNFLHHNFNVIAIALELSGIAVTLQTIINHMIRRVNIWNENRKSCS